MALLELWLSCIATPCSNAANCSRCLRVESYGRHGGHSLLYCWPVVGDVGDYCVAAADRKVLLGHVSAGRIVSFLRINLITVNALFHSLNNF